MNADGANGVSGLGLVPTPLLPSPWDHQFAMRPEGLYFQPPARADFAVPPPRRLSGPFEIVAELKSLDLGPPNPGFLLRIPDGDSRSHEIVVLRAELQGDAHDVRRRLAALGLEISTHKQAKDLFTEALNSAKPSTLGWHTQSSGWKFGHRFFVIPGQASVGGEDQFVHFTGRAESAPYSSSGSLDGWKAEVAARALGNPLLMFSLCVALAGPLIAICGAEGGGFHLVGPSSTGKSTSLWGAASVWGKGGGHGFATTWLATSNGLEGVAAARNDTFLGLDELGRCDPEALARAIYVLSDGQGKERMHADASLKARAQWQCMILSTGELSIEAALRETRRRTAVRAGQELRILTIPTDLREDLLMIPHTHGASSASSFAETYKKASALHYGHAGPALVKALIEDPKRIEWVREHCADFRQHLRSMSDTGQTQRASWRFALCATAGELAIELGLLPWRACSATEVCEHVFEAWAAGFGRSVSRETHGILETMRRNLHLNAHTTFWQVEEDSRSAKAESRPQFHGFKYNDQEEGLLFLIPRHLVDIICPGHDVTNVARALDEAGFLATNDKQTSGRKRYRYRKTINGIKADFIAVKVAILEGD